MCGICGLVDFTGRGPTVEIIREMADTLRHRGPDDEGVFVDGPVGLGHRRLSILDLSPLGHQPMQTQDGRYTVIYNGEIYNYPALRAELESAGVLFKSRADTEALLHGFARWGDEVFRRLNGMYAVAIWDRDQHRLTLARDRFGIKPLYYLKTPRGLIFGSEIKAILSSGRAGRIVNPQALHEYLYYGNALGTRTMFAEIERLLPAHVLTLNDKELKISTKWDVERLTPITDDLETAARTVRSRLEAAVKDHLLSDVPVGVFLSGGIDSSAITAFASRHYSGRLSTYSVHFDFDPVNELPRARTVARHFGTDHHELEVKTGELSSLIERLVICHDEPFADPANIPLYLLCQELKGSVKVVLQGDGGDEMFAGYRRYNVLAHERFWRGVSRLAVMAGSFWPRSPRRQRVMRFFETMNIADPIVRLAMLMTIEQRDEPPTKYFSMEWTNRFDKTDPFARYREMFKRLDSLDAVQRGLYIDSQILLPDTFLEKVDKSTMAHSVEVRVPFLDTNLTDYAMALPSRLKVRNRQKKYILRRALRGVVPDAVLDAPKTGLGVPMAEWLKGPLAGFVHEVLLDKTHADWLDAAAVSRAIDEHSGGTHNHWFILYKLLLLAIWKKRYDIAF